MKIKPNCKKILFIFILTISISLGILNGVKANYNVETVLTQGTTKHLEAENNSDNGYLYLSDIDYIENQSSVAWGSILKDQANGGSKIAVKVDGAYYTFDKGLWAHATSTIVYDLSSYKDDYDYFTTYMALDQATPTTSNGVKFYVYTSQDGTNWDLRTEATAPVSLPGGNARYVEIDIKDVNYLKLYADPNGANRNDFATYADPKLVTQEYLDEQNNLVLSVEEYDQRIKDYPNKDLSDPNYELLVLQRKFATGIGEYALQRFINESADNKATYDWLLKDVENLRYYIVGGTPSGGYFNSLNVLTRLLKEYKSDFDNTEQISEAGAAVLQSRHPGESTTKGNLYKKMVITLSLTHSANVGLWMQSGTAANKSDAVVRYALYKQMYDENKFTGPKRQDATPWFESYSIEEMRFVLSTALDDEEVLWLHDYTQMRIEAGTATLAPHKYIAYIWPNYGNPVYYDEANYEYFNDLFAVIQKDASGNVITDADGNVVKKYMWPVKDNPDALTYNITRGTANNKIYKVWFNLRNKFNTGCVCGGISKTGANIKAVHGIPSTVVGQPGHAAIAYYWRNSAGNGYWALDNNVSGWTLSEKAERLPLGWGNNSRYRNSWNVPYLGMSQEALNRFDQYEKATELVLLADAYTDDNVKREEYLRKALDELDFHLDAWFGLVDLYTKDATKTQEQIFALAEEMGEKLIKYPIAYYDLMEKIIKPKMVDVEYKFKYTLLLTDILNKGKVYNGTDIANPSLTRTEATYLLGQADTSLSTFSFDGDNAGKIVLASKFNGNGVRWDYCITGNPSGVKEENWKEVDFSADEEHKWQLTDDEIASITSANDIYIHIVGVDYSEKNLFKIDILESAGLPSTLYANDWENKMIATSAAMQWKLNEADEWTFFNDAQPDLTGDKTLIVRVAATGVRLASGTTTFRFTTDTDTAERKYIPISHLTLDSFSTEATGQGRYARNAIDGNLNTNWHSNWDGNDTEKYIVIKLDEVKNLTALEYFPLGGGNGKILSAQVLVSVDGEEWTEAVSGTNWTYANTNDISTKVLDFNPVKAQYIKIVGQRTQNSFITARMFNFYENTTIRIVGTFSFDGENAGKIILDNDFKGQGWQYSLDGGTTWKNGSGDEHLLTAAEQNQISVDNQIKMRFDGNPIQYTIKIDKMNPPTLNPYLNDWENRLYNMPTNVSNLEWKIEGTDSWTDYSAEEPIVEGDKKLYIRTKHSYNCAASDPVEYQFTEKNTPTATYIPIRHLSVEGVSSQSVDSARPYYAPNAIDGNPNTIWHTDFRYSIAGTRASYTIKIDSTKYISALEYIQKKYKSDDPIYIRNMYVYVSENGQDWFEAGRLENIPQTEELRRINFEESIVGKYVKIEMQGYGIFASLSMVNLYEDTTRKKAGSFSFDGEEANTIILEDDVKTPNWEYSLDGGNTWKNATGDKHTLTAEEVDEVNGDDNIQLRINNKEYSIDIRNSETPVITAYLNDLENRLIGMTNTDGLEWKIVSNSRAAAGWTDWSEKEPVVEGDSKLLIRMKARNIFAAGQIVEFNFTADNQPDTRKYIPISQLSIAGVSAEERGANGVNGPAIWAIDGNYNTNWLNSTAASDNQRYIIIKFDTAVYLSAMDYVPHAANGRIMSGTITGSMDGENFTDIATISGWANNQNTKTIDFEPVKVRYVKIAAINVSYTNAAKKHMGARMFNFYEDLTQKEEAVTPTAEIEYSITTDTNQDVIASLVNESTEITVLNNDGNKTYTFTEDGEFTFEFEDSVGNKGSATAKVDWIHKTAPVASFEYSTTEETNDDVTVTIKFDKKNVTITNNNGSDTYTFRENGEFTFEFVGPLGNRGTATAKVDWINKVIKKASIKYSKTTKTNEDVVATFDKGDENLTIIGDDTHTFTENGEFTFEYVDDAGNRGTKTARVTWIDKIAPNVRISYSITEATHQPVVVTVSFDKENVTITNNDGNSTYTFAENGTFTFEYVDDAGNTGTATSRVTWIDKTLPVATITYSTTRKTNQDVVATITFDREEGVVVRDGNTHTFTQNGEYEFQFTAANGNVGFAIAKVDWIDKVVPEPLLVYSQEIMTKTKENITARVVFENEEEGEVTITNNNGSNEYTFTENGSFIFEFADQAGNTGSVESFVNCIDRTAPTASISYNVTELTNGNVVATLENESEEITLLNNSGRRSYTFTRNGTFTFRFEDEAGNIGTATASVTWIDKTLPIPSIAYSTRELTNQDVIATISFDKQNVTVDGGNEHTFTRNGEYTFEYEDEAGNRGIATASVNWIDKVAPTASVEYNITEETEGNVVATLVNPSEEITITNNGGSNTHTFTENGTFTFEFVDRVGNTGTATARVTWIATNNPIFDLELESSTDALNSGDEFEINVKVSKLKNINNGLIALSGTFEYDKDILEIIGITGQNSWNFDNNSYNDDNFKFVTENHEYVVTEEPVFKIRLKVKEDAELPEEITFKIVSIKGSNGEIDISAIDSEIRFKDNTLEISSEKYKIDDEFISRTSEQTTASDFKKNIKVNRDIKILNRDGDEIAETDIIATGMKLKVGEELELTIIVTGDIDMDGKLTVNDISAMKLHLIDKQILTGINKKAADINDDKDVGITDLALAKRLYLGI